MLKGGQSDQIGDTSLPPSAGKEAVIQGLFQYTKSRLLNLLFLKHQSDGICLAK